MTASLMIQRVTESAITVSGEPYSHGIALTPDEVLDAWAPGPVADLLEADFAPLVAKAPEIILLGTGPTNLFPPRELLFAFARRGIGLETMDTRAAARTFNVLASEGRRVAAALYL